MNNNEKEIRRIRLEDLDISLQNILLNRVTKDDETWNKIVKVIDGLYDKTNIKKKLVNITITNKDTTNQTVKVLINGKTYTSNFTCYNTDRYRIIITPVAFMAAGKCNVSSQGVFTEDTNIIVEKATKIIEETKKDEPTYSIKVKIGSRNDGGLFPTLGMNETYIWNPSTINDKVGECNPDNIIDILTIWKYGENDYSSYYAFYGGNNVNGLFNKFTSYIIDPKGNKYKIADNIPNSEFNKTGDINNPPLLSTKQIYNLFQNYIGEWITVEIYLT